MYKSRHVFDIRKLGLEVKRKRKEQGFTQEQLGELVGRSSRSIMYMENRGQHPKLDVFYQIVTKLGISVDQFFYPADMGKGGDARKRLDVILNSLDEDDLALLESTAQAMLKRHQN